MSAPHPFHEDLDVFRLSRGLAIDLYRDTAGFPTAERFGLSAQIRRAAVSVPANIAEGAARSSRREFARFLLVSRGSANELRLLLDIARETGCLSLGQCKERQASVLRIIEMLSGLVRRTRRSESPTHR